LVFDVISTEGPVVSGPFDSARDRLCGEILSRTQSKHTLQPDASTEPTLSAAEWAQHDKKWHGGRNRCLELLLFRQN